MPFIHRPYRRFSVQCAVTSHTSPFLNLPLAYLLGLWLLITLLVLSSGPAHAEWVDVGGNDSGITVYVDLETIRRKGDVVKWWELWDNKTVQNVAGESRLSMKIQRESDCAENLHRPLAQTRFSGNMGSGKVGYSNSNEGKWQPVQPNSIGEGLWKVACLLNIGPAYGEWVLVEKNNELAGTMTVYADPDTIRRKGNLVKMWVLFDYKTILTVAGVPFLSSKIQKQFDCGEERIRLLRSTDFSGNMGTGKPFYSNSDQGEWKPVEPKSINQALWEVACNKK